MQGPVSCLMCPISILGWCYPMCHGPSSWRCQPGRCLLCTPAFLLISTIYQMRPPACIAGIVSMFCSSHFCPLYPSSAVDHSLFLCCCAHTVVPQYIFFLNGVIMIPMSAFVVSYFGCYARSVSLPGCFVCLCCLVNKSPAEERLCMTCHHFVVLPCLFACCRTRAFVNVFRFECIFFVLLSFALAQSFVFPSPLHCFLANEECGLLRWFVSQHVMYYVAVFKTSPKNGC